MMVIKALIKCTHFLAYQHIAHTTSFHKLVDLIVSCGGETLQTFLDRQRCSIFNVHLKNGCSKICECSWNMVEESLLERVHKAPFF